MTLTSYSAANNQPANQSQPGQLSGAHTPVACLLQSRSWCWTLATLTSRVFLQLAGDSPITSHYLKQPSEKGRGQEREEEGGVGGMNLESNVGQPQEVSILGQVCEKRGKLTESVLFLIIFLDFFFAEISNAKDKKSLK